MFKSLIAFEPKFGARALAAGSLLSILAIVYGYAAEKPGEDQDNLKKEQQTKRVGERESQKQKMETKRDEREDQKRKMETKRDEREEQKRKMDTKLGEPQNPKKMETKGAGSMMAPPKPAAHWDVSPSVKR